MGAQGIQFQTGRQSWLPPDWRVYKTITWNIFAFLRLVFPANLEMDEAIVGVEFDDGHIPCRRNDPEELRKFSCL